MIDDRTLQQALAAEGYHGGAIDGPIGRQTRIAIDFDPTKNALRWGRGRARMAEPQYAAFLDIWEDEGRISLSRERNDDWMHAQAVRLYRPSCPKRKAV